MEVAADVQNHKLERLLERKVAFKVSRERSYYILTLARSSISAS